MPRKADITGLMLKAKKGWEKRAKKLARPEFFWISIGIEPYLLEKLSIKEQERLRAKLRLVREAATFMAAGMVKGTVKYSSDDYTVEKWLANVVGEGSDLFNYMILLADAFARSKEK